MGQERRDSTAASVRLIFGLMSARASLGEMFKAQCAPSEQPRSFTNAVAW